MAINGVQLLFKVDDQAPQIELLDFGAIAANHSILDRHLRKAKLPELKPLLETAEDDWLLTSDVLSKLESARQLFAAVDDEMLLEIAAEELEQTIDFVKTLPAGSRMRIEVLRSKPKKSAKPQAAAKSSPAAKSPSLALSLPRPAADAVTATMSREESRLTFDGFVAHWLKRDATAALANTRACYPQWPETWLVHQVHFHWICDSPNGWLRRGIARRATSGDLDEFALFLQMHVRQAVLTYYNGEDEFTMAWPLLVALAIGDELALERFLKLGTFPISRGHAETKIIYNGLHALLRQDRAGLDRLEKQTALKKSPAWLKGLIESLQGIAAGDAGIVAAGLDQLLAGYYKGFRVDPVEKALSLEAHGIYRLAERFDPSLVAQFDAKRNVPWDREFHQWSSERTANLSLKHFGDAPQELCEPFVTLESPPWRDKGE